MLENSSGLHKLGKQEYQVRQAPLRTQLLDLQQRLQSAPFPVLVLISGVDGAGKGESVNLLSEWLDPHYLHCIAFAGPSEEEQAHPEFWRFWRTLPAAGHIGLYIGSWYSQPIAERVKGELDEAGLYQRLLRIRNFERELIDAGALIVKVWLHLDKAGQKRRLKKLEANPETAWRVSKLDRQHLKHYDHFLRIAEHTLITTSCGEAPWHVIDAGEAHYRNIALGEYLLQCLREHLEQASAVKPQAPARQPTRSDSTVYADDLLGRLDMGQQLEKKRYQQDLELYQGRLHKLAREAQKRKVSSVIALEGWDAGGKGGLIRRIIPALDARTYRVIPVAAPSDEERAHHYLWRFWRHVPRAGHIAIFDRSWYGRVLVERVEGLASYAEWQRAYHEINDFEAQLAEHQTVVVKFWLHIDQEEQLRRFAKRAQTSYKQYKLTEEDYRNRERWAEYEQAANEMVVRTSTGHAPWLLIEGNDKRYARIKALRHYCERLEQALG